VISTWKKGIKRGDLILGTCFEERNLKLGFKKGEEGNLNFSCIHSLNLYPSKSKEHV